MIGHQRSHRHQIPFGCGALWSLGRRCLAKKQTSGGQVGEQQEKLWEMSKQRREKGTWGAPGILLKIQAAMEAPPERPPQPEVAAILHDFRDVFRSPKGLPPADRPKHVINTAVAARPILKTPRRLSEPQRVALKEQIPQMLEKGWIRPSHSP